jgi:LmbE family N-acetylglucosaminyl deacetylase
MRVLVIAPHPDDEVLGVGGVIARMSREGHEVQVVVITTGQPPLFSEQFVLQVRKEAAEAHRLLGVMETSFLDGFPAAGLDGVPSHRLNEALTRVLTEKQPELLFVPFPGDIHLDHRITFTSALVAARPIHEHKVKAIYAYETLSETNWFAPPVTPGFLPNTFFDITEVLDTKLEALKAFKSQMKSFPNERSLEAVTALAKFRGATVGFAAAEAFVLLRHRQ